MIKIRRNMNKAAFLRSLILLLYSLYGSIASAEQLYYIKEIGAFGSTEPTSFSYANGLNILGQVTGSAWDGLSTTQEGAYNYSIYVTNPSGDMISIGKKVT